MENVKRKLFFWTLVLLFLVTAPVIVFRARGYRFDIHRGVFVHSGTITFKTNPLDVKVSINGEMNESKQLDRINSSYNIGGLLPGDYEMKISQDGYRDWSKKTDVHSGVASEFWNILLVRDNYERYSFNTRETSDFYVSPWSDAIAIFGRDGFAATADIYDIDSEEINTRLRFEGWELDSEGRRENVEWSPEGDTLSIPVKRSIEIPAPRTALQKTRIGSGNKIEYSYLIANIETGEFFNLAEFTGLSDIRRVRWDPDEKNTVIFLSGDMLLRASLEEKSEPSIIAEEVSSFDLSKSKIFYVKRPNNLVYSANFDGSSPSQLTYAFPEENRQIDKLIVYDENRVGFIDNEKHCYVFNRGEVETYFRRLGDNVEGLHFSDDGKKMVFWSGNEISVYFLRKWDVQPARAENELQNITRYADTIKNVQWFRDYEHIIFSTGRWVKIIELDPRDHRNCQDLISTELENPFIRYNGFLEKLYFTEKSSDTTTLQSIDFPEPGPFLGIGE